MTVKTFIFNPVQENTYLVFDETLEAVIIDAGCVFENEYRQIDGFIEYNKLKIKHLLNTHLHFDHILGNKYIADKYGVLPEAHAGDELMIASLESTLRSLGINLSVQGQPIGRYLTETDTVKFGNAQFKILHVPGHSQGSLCFYNEKDGILFSGDTLFRGTVGRTDLPAGDHNTLITNIQQKLMLLPDRTVVYPGHGATTTIGEERKSNPYL
ncbi:MAG: MBL fold metallo-hydrolase [Prevotellaceae bacterium]|jgi:glyoxylase-like metal-dependent hydrolase (beta-lactamase superfamily II)|nr:MBL fold metallo-hydrolase [Prevotellaceae bacterium]